MLLREPYGDIRSVNYVFSSLSWYRNLLWNALVLLSLHQLQGGFQMGVQILKKINHCVEGKEMEAEKIRTR